MKPHTLHADHYRLHNRFRTLVVLRQVEGRIELPPADQRQQRVVTFVSRCHLSRAPISGSMAHTLIVQRMAHKRFTHVQVILGKNDFALQLLFGDGLGRDANFFYVLEYIGYCWSLFFINTFSNLSACLQMINLCDSKTCDSET